MFDQVMLLKLSSSGRMETPKTPVDKKRRADKMSAHRREVRLEIGVEPGKEMEPKGPNASSGGSRERGGVPRCLPTLRWVGVCGRVERAGNVTARL